ncbi:MAG: hypothetical protein LBT96_01590 [Campylobacteraceae bacterium]|jgi:ribosomal protein L18E|nr:hypothetical protein [Campylobacteraceae bacterium]
MSIKTWFLTVFRELFLYHYKSLEFRAKLFALIAAPSYESAKEHDRELLREIAAEIYKGDRHRQGVFLNIVKEYMITILRNPSIAYDEVVKDINHKVKMDKKLAEKINISHLGRFLKTDISEDKRLLQQRIFEFLEEQSKISSR